jgi:hypothetical protein
VTEDLLLSDPHAVVDISHNGGRDLLGGPVGQRFTDGRDRSTVAPLSRASSISPTIRSKLAWFTEEQ